LVNFYQTTRRYNPEDSHLHTHRRENLKSYLVCMQSPIRAACLAHLILLDLIVIILDNGTKYEAANKKVLHIPVASCLLGSNILLSVLSLG
jgi:hypothetical protein